MITNPILAGFCPDPSVIRVDGDYYIATSTFHWWPGIRLFHSRDLQHWKQIPSPVERTSQADLRGEPSSCGLWAPCLTHADGLYWLVYTDVKSRDRQYQNNYNYLIWTDDIFGPWSEPIYLNATGFDPSLFHDPQTGKKYLLNMRTGFRGILMQEYDHESKRLVGESKCIFDGSCMGTTEGPHLYFHQGMYYLLTAEGGTGYKHQATMARSRNIWGPYEENPAGALLTSAGHPQFPLQKAGHADLVQTEAGDWYMVHLCSRPIDGKHSILGRETAIQEVCWTEDGWLRMKNGSGLPELSIPAPRGITEQPVLHEPTCDDFDGDALTLGYSALRYPMGADASVTERPGYLRLHGKESFPSLHHVSMLARRQQHFHCSAQTSMDFKPSAQEHMAGLMHFYDNQHFYMIAKTLDLQDCPVLQLVQCDKGVARILHSQAASEGVVHLRAETHLLGTTFSYSMDGESWVQLGAQCDVSILTDEYVNGFTGAHFALYCHDLTHTGHPADFDSFAYIALE